MYCIECRSEHKVPGHTRCNKGVDSWRGCDEMRKAIVVLMHYKLKKALFLDTIDWSASLVEVGQDRSILPMQLYSTAGTWQW